jgi:hypothetical protein
MYHNVTRLQCGGPEVLQANRVNSFPSPRGDSQVHDQVH